MQKHILLCDLQWCFSDLVVYMIFQNKSTQEYFN